MASLTLQELVDDRLTTRLGMIQNLEAFNHSSRHLGSGVVKFPYKNWLSSPVPVFFKNTGDIFTPDSYDADLGTATYSALAVHDDIFCTYGFKYFSETELMNFLKLAMAKGNNTAPASSFSYTDENYPEDWADFLTAYAYKLCLQTVLVDLMSWKGKLIWTDPIGLASIVQGIMMQIDSEIQGSLKTLKGRRFVNPHSVSAGRWKTPAKVSDNTWQQHTVIRS